jgi:hypothetical protein
MARFAGSFAFARGADSSRLGRVHVDKLIGFTGIQVAGRDLLCMHLQEALVDWSMTSSVRGDFFLVGPIAGTAKRLVRAVVNHAAAPLCHLSH